MKKAFASIIIATLVLSLTACDRAKTGSSNSRQNSTAAASSQTANDQMTSQNPPELTAEEALDIALEQAGVTKDSIRDVETRLETENGILVYEIEFDSGNIEYSYEVNAETGAFVEYDRDHNDKTFHESY